MKNKRNMEDMDSTLLAYREGTSSEIFDAAMERAAGRGESRMESREEEMARMRPRRKKAGPSRASLSSVRVDPHGLARTSTAALSQI